ncbi:ParB/RepB/Spo0J family partition protein [Actinomadura alba]|uniref:ParB/RepB/Spo0J family partition protein n=2 Tax=Actinomadura alba TaxID=406431 RepID=UPI0028AA3974|nr:ParB/RepB/Spo0J family partition protein [Actinomadura alba]
MCGGHSPRGSDPAEENLSVRPLTATKTHTVSISALRPGDSPRQTEDEDHVNLLAESEASFPPILVHRSSMQIIDGHHRCKAAILRGHDEIEVVFFDGNEEEAFIRAVEENIAHGLSLSLADRKAAATRILTSRPSLSDRAIAAHTGLAAKTVAGLRRCSTEEPPRSNTRRGLDGRNRPVNAVEGRRRAAEAIAQRPDAPLREIAKAAGVSLGTAHDVRWRMRRGEDPVPCRRQVAEGVQPPAPFTGRRPAVQTPGTDRGEDRLDLPFLLRRLVQDPALRQTDGGRQLLRLLHTHSATSVDWPAIIDAVPPHCAETVIKITRECARSWELLARTLEYRTKPLS